MEKVDAETPRSAAIACSISARCARICAACERAVSSCVCACATSRPGGDAGAVALLGEGERMVVGLDRIVEDRILAVEAAQLHVIVNELGEQRQARVLQVRRRGLRIGLAREDLVADLSPKVELIAHAAAEDVVIVVARCRRPDQRRVHGLAGARHSRVQAERGEETCARLIAERLGLCVVGERGGQGGIAGDESLLRDRRFRGSRTASTSCRAADDRPAAPASRGRVPCRRLPVGTSGIFMRGASEQPPSRRARARRPSDRL